MDSKAVLFLSRYHATFREPVRLGRMGKHQTHLCVIGRIRLVIGVGEAHPSWGLEVQHVGNLERRRRSSFWGGRDHSFASFFRGCGGRPVLGTGARAQWWPQCRLNDFAETTLFLITLGWSNAMKRTSRCALMQFCFNIFKYINTRFILFILRIRVII